jgi:hypothetical protein
MHDCACSFLALPKIAALTVACTIAHMASVDWDRVEARPAIADTVVAAKVLMLDSPAGLPASPPDYCVGVLR